jgi:hypothetical protein
MDIAALQLTLRRFGEELLQLADRTVISLHAGPGAKTHVLVDWENVQPNEAECRALVPEATDVWLFHGPNQKNVGGGYATFGDRVTEVRIARTGKNALDFHLSFYMGYIASKHPDARFVVLSNDKGYGPMLDHAKELGFVASQSGFAAARVTRTARKAPAKKAAAKQAPARKATAAPAKEVAAKKVPVRKAAARKAPAAAPAPASAKTATAKKSFDQVLAILKKSPAASRPRKHARLLAYVASRMGAGSGAEAEAMLARLAAEGKIAVDEKRNVSYRL